MTKEQIYTDTLIIGAGFSGLYLANILLSNNYSNFLVVAPDKVTVSDKSYYNFRSRGVRQQSLKDSIIKTGDKFNNYQLVNVFINNIDDEITKLSRLTELKPSYMGAQVVNINKFLSKLKQAIVDNRLFDEVVDIKKTRNQIIVATAKNIQIICRDIVFCSGGSRFTFSDLFSDEKVNNGIFSIAKKLGCKLKYPNKIMYHPFYIRNICIPSDNLSSFIVVNDKGEKLEKTNELLEAHNTHHCFNEILKEMKKFNNNCFAIKGEQKIKLDPAPHYRLGGIQINKRGQTNIKNFYALGECSFGLHGFSRLGGCSLSEIIVMARIISQQLL